MKVTELELPGLRLIEPTVYGDARGFFLETWSAPRYGAAEIDCEFVQDNHSRSTRGTLRGLHYQSSPGQAKLMRVAVGKIFDVAVDIRPESSTFGKWQGVYLDAQQHHQLFVPLGFAHGFCVVSDVAEVLYKVSSPYEVAKECGLAWDDPDIGVTWPVNNPLLSARDQQAESFADYRNRVQR